MRETEKIMKEMQAFMERNATADMEIDDLNELARQFMEQQNQRPKPELTEKTAKTADDWLELAEKAWDAGNESNAFRLARKALKLDPQNFDAESLCIRCGSKDPFDYMKKLEQAIARATKIMEREGYMDAESTGRFWGILETRPYMRLWDEYSQILLRLGMMRKAMSAYEEMIRLCENDNLGSRFALMHLYAFLEEEKKAASLYKQFEECDQTMMVLPLSVLYYKMGDFIKAEKYLKRLAKFNKDTKAFFQSFVEDRTPPQIELNKYGYRPYSMEELLVDYSENDYLFKSVGLFFQWAYDVLKKGRR